MERQPVILTVTRNYIRKNKIVQFSGNYHLDLLYQFGAMPVMVPAVRGTLSALAWYKKLMCGLLIVEGPDIDPDRYGLPQHLRRWLQKDREPVKDSIEFSLIEHALENKIPYLGFCRGSELLNVVNGGTLYADVMKEKGTRIKHIDYRNYDGYRHRVRLVNGTPLSEWYKKKELMVNSYHHQGVKTLAKRFVPMAHSDDGLIEGFYDPKEKFLMGIQFHPERMLPDYEGNPKVFESFVRAAKKYQGQ